MPKMSLERFREIKDRLTEIINIVNEVENETLELTEEEEEKLDEELEILNDEIHCSDLSDIPFEEYEGFYDLGFDFEGTGANLDFSLIDSSMKTSSAVRVKGCSIRNFDFENQMYDDKSFDEDFMKEHKEMFLDKDLPDDVKKRYYLRRLSVEDVIRYDLYDEISRERVSKDTKDFFKKVPIDVVQTIDLDIYNSSELGYYFRRNLEEFDGEVTKESIETLMRKTVEEYFDKNYITIKSYKEVISIPKVREFIPDERIIDFGENNDLGTAYLSGSLSVGTVFSNSEIFKGKKFVHKLSGYEYYPQRFEGITEEKLFYLFDNYPDISEGLIFNTNELMSIARGINPESSKEENLSKIQEGIVDLLNGDTELDLETQKALERYYSLEAVASRLSEYDKYHFDVIMQYTTQEKIESYGISARDLENSSILSLFSTYGLETVIEFDRANGNVFSENNFDLAKKMSDYYFHYASNEHNPNRSIYYRSHDPEKYTDPYEMDDFEEAVRRMIINGPTDWNYSKLQPINFKNFSDRFREKYPRMFLEKNAPEELQDKFYTKSIVIEDLGLNPNWIDYLEGIDFEIGMQMPAIAFRNPNDYGNYHSFVQALKMLDSSESNMLRFLNDNSKTIKLLEMYCSKSRKELEESFENIQSLDALRERCETEVENQILSGVLEYGEPYIPDFFKEKHPDLVLDENAPEELKAKFYSLYYENGNLDNRANLHRLTIEDLVNEEFQPFLVGKSFELTKNADQVKNITKVFDFDTINDLYKIDPSAFEIYCLNVENANTLKEVLAVYPDKYAREELIQGLKLSDEEFENRLVTDDEFKTKFDALKREYLKDLVSNPGFVLHLEPEQRSRESLRQYKILSSSNMLHSSNRFSRDSYEQILGHMLGFLGYEEARKLLEVPEIDEDTLNRIYQQDEIIKSLYEKKFEITGNIKVIGKLLEGVPTLMPTAEKITSKATCKIFMSINKRIQEGYNGDITSLLKEALSENGVEIDDEKVNGLVQKVVGISTAQKLDSVRENNSVLIDTSIEENQKTKNMIKIHYRNALEYSLNKSERIDSELVREYLEKEFSKVKEDGQLYYSPHVTDHLEELVEFSRDLGVSPEWNRKLNHSVVDNLKEESVKIGKGWIRKITSNVCYKPEKLTYEQAERLDATLYPEGSDLEVEMKPTIGLKELSEEEKAKLYELLNNEQFRGLFSYGKAENMFSTLKFPYSEKFKEFFLKYKDEFIGNPDLYAKFPILASKFNNYLEDSGFNTRYKEGTLTPEDVLLKLSTDVYPNLEVAKGEHEVIYQARSAGLTEEQAKIALRLFQDMKKREYQTVPQEQFETKRFRGRIVRMDDPLHFAIGEITNCCQTIGLGQPGESSMIHSATERNGALFIVEELDEAGKSIGIVSQSWTWRNGNRVCFDNVEIPSKVKAQLSQVGGFDEIMDVYQEAARIMIETDKIKLRKLLEKGKITEEQFKTMMIKDVTMGLGCDDLVGSLSKEKREKFKEIPSVSPIEAGKTYTGASSRTLYTDSGLAILIEHNNDFAKDDHSHNSEEVGNYGVKYVKTRDIFRRKGFDIDSDKIESISRMVENSERISVFQGNPINIAEIASNLGIRELGISDADKIRMSMSENSDWYVLSEETSTGIIIHETGVDLSNPKTETETLDRRMALGEYTREIYKIMLEAASKGKTIAIDSYSTNKFFNLESLIDEGIISVDNGIITVNNEEKLTGKIESSTQVLDSQRRERLTIVDKDETERE